MTLCVVELDGAAELLGDLAPQEAVDALNAFLNAMTDPVAARGGVVDSVLGGAILARFCDGGDVAPLGHAGRACLAALARRERAAELAADLSLKLGRPVEIDIRQGIATGETILGPIGPAGARMLSALGPTVAVAGQLKGASRMYGTSLLVSQTTAERAAGAVELREIDRVRLPGRSWPVRLYDVMAPAGDLSAERAALRTQFGQALAAYRARDFARAHDLFMRCAELDPDDQPTQVFLERIDLYVFELPGPEWDGAWQLADE
jgi:adenylate cyclase